VQRALWDFAAGSGLRDWTGAVAMIGFPPHEGVCVGMNERSGRRATRLVARLLMNPAQRCERGRCRLRAGQNGVRHCGRRSAAMVS